MTFLYLLALGSAVAAAAVAKAVADKLVHHPPATLLRTNISGRQVPVVLGISLVAASFVGFGLLAVSVFAFTDFLRRFVWVSIAVLALIVVVMGAAGLWDDLRGDERPRGFRGHLAAARSGRLTGGMVKLAAGLLCGAVAASSSQGARAILVLLAVPLTANLINLLDRAPGRALKVSAVLVSASMTTGSVFWILLVSPVVGAAAGVAALDLKERGMLGDAGANPLGAVVGLGLVLALPLAWSWVYVATVLALNLASERWSFSKVIEGNRVLAWIDGLGRK